MRSFAPQTHLQQISNRHPFKFPANNNFRSICTTAPRRRLPSAICHSRMATRTMSNRLKQAPATAPGVVAPPTTTASNNLKQPPTAPDVVAPRTTTSNLKQPPTAPRTTATSKLTTAPGRGVAPRAASKRATATTTASVVAPAAPRTTTSNNLPRRRAPAAGNNANRVVQAPPPPHAKTSSRRVAETDTATHDFTVAGYSNLKTALGVGQYVSSDPFLAGGHEWEIRFYPKLPQAGGAIADYRPPFFPGGASLHLRDADHDTELTVRFTLGVVLQPNGRTSPMATRTATEVFGMPPGRLQRHGFHRLVEGGMLSAWRRRRCVRNDALTIRCALTVSRAADPVPRPDLAAHLAGMLASGLGADVTFRVGGHRAFPAHRALLAARSPVFRAELFGGMAESAAPCVVKVVGVRPEIFELLLRFVYTDALPGDGDGCDAATIQHLLVAADRYGLDRLKRVCEGKLHASVDEETVKSMLDLAERHGCPRLRDVCVACMSSSSGSLVKSQAS